MRLTKIFLLFAAVLMAGVVYGQCPDNIGFESGTFKNWVCYSGAFSDNTGRNEINWTQASGPIDDGRHTISIVKNTSPQELDPYGGFPKITPNGSMYSLQLGNDAYSSAFGREIPAFAERVTYDFTVPSDSYTLICYYAVVFQNPKDHDDFQQPKFIANVHNIDNPADDVNQCGNFQFTSSAGLQGFKKSDSGADIYYKPWSALVIKISGRKGKHFQLEFIARDCAKGGHFGYAYLDFNESNCDSPVTGNQYCSGQDVITLTAPPGFETYKWTDANGNEIGQNPTLKINKPFPPDGTEYNLSITPYSGLGCATAFTVSIQKMTELFNLQVVSNMSGCKSDGIDLTQASVTAGSSPGMKFEYYTDPDAQNFLSDPKMVTQTGDYYIRGTNAYGCTGIAQIHLDLYQGANLTIANHPPICAPATYDLTKLATSDQPVTYSYYSDALLKTQLTTAQASVISKSGTYYIKAVSTGVPCITIEPVALVVSALPKDPDFTQAYASCPPLNLYLAIGATSGGDSADGVTYTFYTDAAGKNVINGPTNITLSGTYYYKGVNQYGCEGRIGKVPVNVYPVPFFKVTDPDVVVYPQTINLMYTHPPLTFANFTYWKDAACTKPLDNYQTISESGTYYIKAINTTGCEVTAPVHVLVNAPAEVDLVGPNTFTPNGDGINDTFMPTTTGVPKVNYIKILNRYGNEVFYTTQLYNHWDGTYNGKPVPPGTYYWMFSAYDVYRKKSVMRSGRITLIR